MLGRAVRRALLLALFLCGCKSQQTTLASPRIDSKRTDPLTVEEVENAVRSVAAEFGTCYRNERRQLFAEELSDYVLQLRVPIDGSQPEITVVKATIAGQEALEHCLVMVLSRLRFPAHPGKRITLNVPIEEGR